jgi:hypothetical protein
MDPTRRILLYGAGTGTKAQKNAHKEAPKLGGIFFPQPCLRTWGEEWAARREAKEGEKKRERER